MFRLLFEEIGKRRRRRLEARNPLPKLANPGCQLQLDIPSVHGAIRPFSTGFSNFLSENLDDGSPQ